MISIYMYIGDISRTDRERITNLSFYEHLGICLTHPEIREIIGSYIGVKVGRHDTSIFSRNTKRYECSNISEYGMYEVFWDLPHELISYDESESVFASLG